MALTPDMIQQMNAATGNNVPLDPNAPPSRAQQVLTIAKQAQAAKDAATSASAPKLGQGAAGDFAGNLIRSVASPLVRTGALVEKGLDQSVGRIGNAIAGKGFTPTHTGDNAAETADTIDTGASDSLAGKAGSLIGTIAPYFTGAGEEETAAQVASMLPKLAEHLGMSAESLIPKITGFLARNAPTAVRDTAIGTAQTGDLGEGAMLGVGGTALKGVLSGGGAFIKDAMAVGTKGALARAIYGTNPDKITQSLVDSYNKVPLPKGVMQEEAQTGKSFSDFMASKPYLSMPVDNMKWDTFGTAQKLRAEVKPEAQALSSLLEHSQATISENKVVDEMKSAVSNIATGQEREGVNSFIDREVPILVEQFARNTVAGPNGERMVSVADWNKIKQILWDRSPFKATASRADNLKSSVDYAMGRVLRQNIENAVPEADVKELNSQIGDYYHAIETLENLHGGAAPKGRLGLDMARIAGTVAGSPGGVVGNIVGYMTADKVAQWLSNPEITTALKRNMLEQLRVTRPSVASQVADILEQQAKAQGERLRLPEGSVRAGGLDSMGRPIDAEGKIRYKPQGGVTPSSAVFHLDLTPALPPANPGAIQMPPGKGITTTLDKTATSKAAAGESYDIPQQQLHYYLDGLGR